MSRSPCLVVATSGRLLAQALATAGCRADVLDGFADLDCRRLARSCRALPWSAPDDPAPASAAVQAAVADWAAAHPDGILVAGSGFEHRPALLAWLATRLALAGSPPAACAAAKDPWQLAHACQALAVSTPELCQPHHHAPAGWLSRLAGGCGGAHLVPAAADPGGPGRVWQRIVGGLPVSLLFHVDARTCTGLSCQQQWLAPAPGRPWRFGGVVAADPAASDWAEPLLQAAAGLATRFGLRGLNGIDAVWDGTRLWVVEINPRPTASLALLTDAACAHWMRAHVASARGAGTGRDAASHRPGLPPGALPALAWDRGAHALNAGAAVVYASTRLSIPADFRFPPGCHDLPRVPHTCGPGEPVCSVHVSTGGAGELRTLIGNLRERLLPLAGADALSSLEATAPGEADREPGLSAR